MSDDNVWFIRPGRFPWRGIEPVHPKGWRIMGLLCAGFFAVMIPLAIVAVATRSFWLVIPLVVLVIVINSLHDSLSRGHVADRDDWMSRKSNLDLA